MSESCYLRIIDFWYTATMKQIYFLGLIILLLLTACQDKLKKESQIMDKSLTSLNVKLSKTKLSCRADSIDLMKVSRLSQREYDQLQLYNVKELQGYTISDLSNGRVVVDDEYGKILTVQIITDGEITELLLSYNKEGKLQDNLIVAYEDLVEYYTQVTSMIESDSIMVQTVNFTYDGEDGNSAESSDTTVVKYQITPEFKFVTN